MGGNGHAASSTSIGIAVMMVLGWMVEQGRIEFLAGAPAYVLFPLLAVGGGVINRLYSKYLGDPVFHHEERQQETKT
jgi:hypothetical protein